MHRLTQLSVVLLSSIPIFDNRIDYATHSHRSVPSSYLPSAPPVTLISPVMASTPQPQLTLTGQPSLPTPPLFGTLRYVAHIILLLSR